MLWNRKSRKAVESAGGVRFAGRHWAWEDVCKNYLFMGGVGSGKTFASNFLIKELMRAGCPILSVCVKPDDFARLKGLAEEVGQAHRVVEITPANTGMNLMDALLAPDGNTSTAAHFLCKIGDVGSRSGGGGDHKFWESQGDGRSRRESPSSRR